MREGRASGMSLSTRYREETNRDGRCSASPRLIADVPRGEQFLPELNIQMLATGGTLGALEGGLGDAFSFGVPRTHNWLGSQSLKRQTGTP